MTKTIKGPAYSKGASDQRAAFMAKFRRELRKLPPVNANRTADGMAHAQLLNHLIEFARTCRARYEKRVGGLGKT